MLLIKFDIFVILKVAKINNKTVSIICTVIWRKIKQMIYEYISKSNNNSFLVDCSAKKIVLTFLKDCLTPRKYHKHVFGGLIHLRHFP